MRAKRFGQRADYWPNIGNNPHVQDRGWVERSPPQEDEADVCVLTWREMVTIH